MTKRSNCRICKGNGYQIRRIIVGQKLKLPCRKCNRHAHHRWELAIHKRIRRNVAEHEAFQPGSLP